MSNPTVDVNDTELDAQTILDAADELLVDDELVGDIAVVDGIIFKDDGYTDDDVKIIDTNSNKFISTCYNMVYLRTEAEAASEPQSGFYVRAESANDSGYAFEIPLEESDKFVLEYGASMGDNPHYAAWDTDTDVSDLTNTGSTAAERELADPNGFDGYAAVDSVEIVER